MAQIGINFRQTAVFVTDGADQDYNLGSTSSRTLNGYTHSWEQDQTFQARNRTNASNYTPELSGVNYCQNSHYSGPKVVRVVLPAAGTYRVGFACGDTNVISWNTIRLYDNTTLRASLGTDVEVPQYQYMGIDGVIRTPANWRAVRPTALYTFSSTLLRLSLGGTGSTAGATCIAHLYVEQVPALASGAALLMGL